MMHHLSSLNLSPHFVVSFLLGLSQAKAVCFRALTFKVSLHVWNRVASLLAHAAQQLAVVCMCSFLTSSLHECLKLPIVQLLPQKSPPIRAIPMNPNLIAVSTPCLTRLMP